jgi:hypothetical protein
MDCTSNMDCAPDINDPFAWEMPLIAQLRAENIVTSISMPPAFPPGAYFRDPRPFTVPQSLLEALDYCIRGMRLAVIYKADTQGRASNSARIANFYIHETLIKQLKAAEDDECGVDLLRRSTDLLHQMYNYIAPRIGMSFSCVRPPTSGDRCVEDVTRELHSMIPEFRRSVALKDSKKQARQLDMFVENYPVFGMFPLLLSDL